MKSIKYLPIIVFLSIIPSFAFAGEHPQANFGAYGIHHFRSISDYQKNYVGEIVKYLPSSRNPSDAEFIGVGGNFNKEYTITKISGNNKRMTFILEEVNGKSKIKFVVNNQDEYYTLGKDLYCITNEYTVPLFLIGKFNEDKKNFIGKTFGNDRYEITDARINKTELRGDNGYKAYPKIAFVVTDKTDGGISFVDANNVNEMDELGKVYTNPLYKCQYTVVGIESKELTGYNKYNFNLPYTYFEKYYTIKNSISGKTKSVAASSSEEDAFNGDNSGHFLATLKKVEKPSNASVRYGETTTLTDKDITKFGYIDNFIDILIFASTSQLNFVLKNVSNNTIKVVWNEAVFVDVDGSTSKIMHSGIKYSQREEDQPVSTIIKGAKLDDIAVPTANVYYDDVLKEWTTYSLYHNAAKNTTGQTIRLMLPIQVMDVINEYIFEFDLTYVYDHPEYLADK